jgi:hypothetical protein
MFEATRAGVGLAAGRLAAEAAWPAARSAAIDAAMPRRAIAKKRGQGPPRIARARTSISLPPSVKSIPSGSDHNPSGQEKRTAISPANAIDKKLATIDRDFRFQISDLKWPMRNANR